jgi:MFS family permease
MGLGGEWGLGVALVMETWPNTSRPMLAGLLGGAANVGFLVAAWLTKWLSSHPVIGTFENWRVALMLGFVPAMLTLVVRLFVRESERWMQSREKSLQAKFSDLFKPDLRRQSLIGIAVSAVAVLGMWGVFQAWLQAWVQSLVEAMPGATPETVGLARAQVGIYMAVGAILGSVAAGPLAHTMGRRASYALFCVGSLISAGLLYGTCDALGPRLLAFTFLGGAFSAAFFGWLPLFLPELFPTHLRASGEGLTFNAGRTLSAAGVLVAGELSHMLGGPDRASLLMSLIFVVGLVLVPFIPETRGQELPD